MEFNPQMSFLERRKFTEVLVVASGEARQHGLQLYLHPLEVFKWRMSVEKELKNFTLTSSVDRISENQQSHCSRESTKPLTALQRGLSDRLKADLGEKFVNEKFFGEWNAKTRENQKRI